MKIQFLLLALPLAAVACSAADDIVDPKSPKVTAEKASLSKIDPKGIELLVELAATNPNDIDLEARNVTAKVVLDGQYDMGTVEIPQEVDLPTDQEVRVSVPVVVDWKDASVVLNLVALKRSIPYNIDGDVKIGVDLFKFTVPFHVNDVITEEQIKEALPGVR